MEKREEITALWKTAAIGTIKEVVAAGHEMLGCSILLGDSILSVAAAACPVGESSWSWEDYIRAGYAPDFKQEVIPPAGEEVVLSDRCSGWNGKNLSMGWDYILLDLRTTRGTSYHLVLDGDGEVPLWEMMELVDVLCQALLAVIDRNSGTTDRLTVEQFLNWLLEGDHREERMLEVRARLMNFQTEGFFHLLTIDIASYRPRENSVSTISAWLEQLVNGISTIYGQRLVLLERCRQEADSEEEKHLEELEELLRDYGLTGARSRMFYTLRDVPFYYRQTEEILRLAYCGGGRNLLDFSHMELYLLASRLHPEEQRESVCHPVVRRLAELDRESKFGYVATLKAYLQSGQRATVACKRLHIHRNTLDYRLRKMGEQVSIDWADGELLFRLYFSICLLEVLGRLDKKNLPSGAD